MEVVGRTLIIANPKGVSLRKSGAMQEATAAADGEQVVLVRTEYAGHAGDYCREHAREFDKIIAIGGDGLMMDVVNGAAGSEAAVAPLPAGSGSDLARALPGYPVGLKTLLAARDSIRMDLGKVTFDDGGWQYFVTEAGTGMDAACVRYIPSWLRRIKPSLAYDVGSIRAILQFKGFQAQVELDDEMMEFERLQLLAVCNTRYFGAGMPVAPDAEIDDGKFRVFVLADASRFEIIRNFTMIRKGTHITHPRSVYRTCREVRLRTDVKSGCCIDGDLVERAPCTWEIQPGALRVIAPSGG